MPLLPDWSAIKAGNKADRRKRTIQRNLRGKKLNSSYVSHAAPQSKLRKSVRSKPKPSLAHPVSPSGRKPTAHAARPAKTATASTVSKARVASTFGYNLVPPTNSKARNALNYNGGYSTAHKLLDGAVRGTPNTSKMVRKSSKSVPLASSTPPMPRGKVTKSSGGQLSLGKRIGAAFAANKGNNERLAKSRMLTASKRG